jgi:hypothetical protein
VGRLVTLPEVAVDYLGLKVVENDLQGQKQVQEMNLIVTFMDKGIFHDQSKMARIKSKANTQNK